MDFSRQQDISFVIQFQISPFPYVKPSINPTLEPSLVLPPISPNTHTTNPNIQHDLPPYEVPKLVPSKVPSINIMFILEFDRLKGLETIPTTIPTLVPLEILGPFPCKSPIRSTPIDFHIVNLSLPFESTLGYITSQ
jgi:hypothetical protein